MVNGFVRPQVTALIHGSFGAHESVPKWHLNRFSRFAGLIHVLKLWSCHPSWQQINSSNLDPIQYKVPCWPTSVSPWHRNLHQFRRILQQRLPMLLNSTDNPQKLHLLLGRSAPHLIHGSLRPPNSSPLNGNLTASVIFAGLRNVKNRQTDQPSTLLRV